jgi:hypothetical protein
MFEIPQKPRWIFSRLGAGAVVRLASRCPSSERRYGLEVQQGYTGRSTEVGQSVEGEAASGGATYQPGETTMTIEIEDISRLVATIANPDDPASIAQVYRDHLLRLVAAELRVSNQLVIAREMFSKSYFALRSKEKLTVDETALKMAAGNWKNLAIEEFSHQMVSGGGF